MNKLWYKPSAGCFRSLICRKTNLHPRLKIYIYFCSMFPSRKSPQHNAATTIFHWQNEKWRALILLSGIWVQVTFLHVKLVTTTCHFPFYFPNFCIGVRKAASAKLKRRDAIRLATSRRCKSGISCGMGAHNWTRQDMLTEQQERTWVPTLI